MISPTKCNQPQHYTPNASPPRVISKYDDKDLCVYIKNDVNTQKNHVNPEKNMYLHKNKKFIAGTDQNTVPLLSQKNIWKRQPVRQTRYNLRHSPTTQRTNFVKYAAKTLLAQHIFHNPSVSHIYDTNGKRKIISQLLTGNCSTTWMKSMSMELGRLAQGNKYGVKATN